MCYAKSAGLEAPRQLLGQASSVGTASQDMLACDKLPFSARPACSFPCWMNSKLPIHVPLQAHTFMWLLAYAWMRTASPHDAALPTRE